MKEARVFDPIRVALPRERVYRRLGFRKDMSRIEESTRRMVDDFMDAGLDIITLKGAARCVPIVDRDASKVVLDTNDLLRGRKLAEFLGDSIEVAILAATAGDDIMTAIRENTQHDDLTQAVVWDAMASEMVDVSLDWIVGFMNRYMRRENKWLTKRRYSAGYGDFSLEHQVTIHRLLCLDRIGVAVNDSFQLVPEKSVTAVAGVFHRKEGKGDR